MKKVLYITRGRLSFYEIDRKTLEEKFLVRSFLLRGGKADLKFFLNIFRLIVFILKNSPGAEAIFIWFADYQAGIVVFLAKIFRKKVIIFSGGTDTICYPEFNKGVFCKKNRAAFVRFAFRNAYHILPNHSSLIYHENFYYSAEGKKDGIRYYIPDIKTPMTVIENGIDTSLFYRDPEIRKEPDFILSVGTMSKETDFIAKGFDLVVELAKRNPGLKIAIIGPPEKFMPWIEMNYHVGSLNNLSIVFFSPVPVLFRYYNRASVYIQASITEGIPNAMLEAMLCECIPVGSEVNGIPDAIGRSGVILKHRSADELEKAVSKALTMDTQEQARENVLVNYSYEKHKTRLLQIIDNIL